MQLIHSLKKNNNNSVGQNSGLNILPNIGACCHKSVQLSCYFKELEHKSYLQNFISLSSSKPLRVFLKSIKVILFIMAVYEIYKSVVSV